MHTSSNNTGICELCDRETNLTLHHLIPKKLHRRTFFKKNYSKEYLNQGIEICQLCHKGIHKIYDEMTLAKQYSTLKALKADEALQRHFEWVAKQTRPFKR